MNVNIDLMEQYVIQISGGIMINVDVIVKKYHVCAKDVLNPAICNGEKYHNIIDSCKYLLIWQNIKQNKSIYYHSTSQIRNWKKF